MSVWKCPKCSHEIGRPGGPKPPRWARYCDNGHELVELVPVVPSEETGRQCRFCGALHPDLRLCPNSGYTRRTMPPSEEDGA